jgi:hypothetical protein
LSAQWFSVKKAILPARGGYRSDAGAASVDCSAYGAASAPLGSSRAAYWEPGRVCLGGLERSMLAATALI